METARRRSARAPDTESGSEPSVVLVTTDSALADEVALIAAVTGVRMDHRSSWEGVDPGAEDILAVLCSPDRPPPGPRQAAQTFLLGSEATQLWETAARVPGLTPVPFPQGEAWLSETLSSRLMARGAGPMVLVAGSYGGVGATTFAYLLAAETAVREGAPLLLDAVPGPGSGIRDLLRGAGDAGSQAAAGLGWEQLAAVSGEISAANLLQRCPRVDGVSVLTSLDPAAVAQPAPQVDPARLAGAARAGTRAFDVVVVDVGRSLTALEALSEQADELLVVTRASRRGVDAADELLRQVQLPAAAVITNGVATPGWGAAEVAGALGLPVVADCAAQRWLARADEPAEAYELLRSGRGARLMAGIMEELGLGGFGGREQVAGQAGGTDA